MIWKEGFMNIRDTIQEISLWGSGVPLEYIYERFIATAACCVLRMKMMHDMTNDFIIH
jgi:hypothetical protein